MAFAIALAQTPTVPGSTSAATGTDTVQPAGKIDIVTGDVRVSRPGAALRRVLVGDSVSEGDLLVTAKDSEVQMTMQDSGYIALRPGTRFRIVKYRADGGDDDKGVFSLLVGGMRSVTGWIGRYNQSAYQVRTPSATIGIRGTDHETRYLVGPAKLLRQTRARAIPAEICSLAALARATQSGIRSTSARP